MLRLALRAILEDEHYLIAEAANGFEALEQLEEFRPQLILLDQRMPGMSGTEFLTAAKALTDVPALVVTGYDHQGRDDFPGCAEVLTKPVERDELLRQVAWHLVEGRKVVEARSAEIVLAKTASGELPKIKRDGLARCETVGALMACGLFAAVFWLLVEVLTMQRLANQG